MKEKKEKVKITKLTNEKYLNLYTVEYVERGVKWTVASRRNEKELEVLSKLPHADAVNILAYGKDEKGEEVVFLINEFRHPLNAWMYSVPAGLVENGKSEEETVKAEIFEEIGGKVLSVSCTDKNVYTTAGLTDEKLSFYEAEVEISGKQHLESSERIKLVPTSLKKLEKMLDDEKYIFDLKGRYALRLFLEKRKNEKLSEKLANVKKK